MKKIVFFLIVISWLFIFSRPASAQTNSQIFSLRVLYVVINPVEGNLNLYETYLKKYLMGKTADQFTDYWANQWIDSFKRLSGNTINYSIAKKVQVTTFPRHTQGIEYTLESYNHDCLLHGGAGSACEAHAPDIDYPAFINDNHLCEIAAQNNIDEIWVMASYALQNGEDYVIGPSVGPWTNGPPGFIISSCQKYYNITVGDVKKPYYFLESYGHRVESNLLYLAQNWRNEDYQKYIGNFTTMKQFGGSRYDSLHADAYCGNVHYPHNATQAYDYVNQTYKKSNCLDWKNFPNLTGVTQNINCQAWQCNDNILYLEFWLGSLPRSDGEATLVGANGKPFAFKKNWWYYLLYPDNALNFVNNPPSPCDASCNDDNQCSTNYCFAPRTALSNCRNRSCEMETDCVCPRQCNWQCSSDTQCQKINPKFICVQRTNSMTTVCRNPDCPDDVSCCPPVTATPIPTITTLPNCSDYLLGNLDCDPAGLVNETDLTIRLNKWGEANLPSIEILRQNWKSY